MSKKENVLNIYYYGAVPFEEEMREVFLVEKQNEDGKISKELQIEGVTVADVNEKDAIIEVREEFLGKISDKDILAYLNEKEAISIDEKEMEKRIKERKTGDKEVVKKEDGRTEEREIKKKIEGNRYNNEDKKQKGEEEKLRDKKEDERNNQTNANDVEIDMNMKITESKRLCDLVPELKEKHVQKVKVTRSRATEFEFYGEDTDGNKITLESIQRVEGTNPVKEVYHVNEDGSQVKQTQTSGIFRIANGGNEQNGNEGFTISQVAQGNVEVNYYRRTRDNDYISIPVSTKNTNPKIVDRDVKEFMQVERNPSMNDNIEEVKNILEQDKETTLDNIDDDYTNDDPSTMQEYVEELIKEAAKRSKVSEQEFIRILKNERKEGEPIKDSIERAEDEINEQAIGSKERTI